VLDRQDDGVGPAIRGNGNLLAEELRQLFLAIEDEPLLNKLQSYRWTGRLGYSLRSLWRAYLASYVLALPNTMALVRRLHEDPVLAMTCGFDGRLPSRWTFNRFFSRLSEHRDLVQQCLDNLTAGLYDLLPGFGSDVAVDSTTVRTHSNPHRQPVSDPEASWTAKSRRNDREKEWYFGYKLHLAVDATYELPIGMRTTTASRNDSPELLPLLRKAKSRFPWFTPTSVIADAGYDSKANCRGIYHGFGAKPIIQARNLERAHTMPTYNKDGVPYCLGRKLMEYMGTHPVYGHRYRCPREGCHLKKRKGVHYCDDEVWVQPEEDLRLIGPVARVSPEWKRLWSMRSAVERVNSRLKECRRLESHCFRGLRKVALHCLLSVLVLQALALVHAETGTLGGLRRCVLKVA
jgi:IS5 family transposase